MDREFLERAAAIELRLEAEGMFLTAEAIRQVINTYVMDHSKQETRTYHLKNCVSEARLTTH